MADEHGDPRRRRAGGFGPDGGGTTLEALRPGRLLCAAAGLALCAALAVGTLDASATAGPDPGRPEIVDFHPFHIAGRLALEGRFAEAYDLRRMGALQKAEGGGRDVFMPFVYPPVFGLIAAPLALLPVAPSFLLFGAATLALWLAVLRRLAGPWFALAALVSAPAALIDLRIGQNGLLTGGLAGLAALLSLRGRGTLAGIAAGLLAFKPQVGAGLALALVLRRDGRAVAAAAAVCAALAGLAALAFGPGSFAAWRGAVATMGQLMTPDVFPLHRSVSAYACLVSLGLPPAAAMPAHAALALAAVAAAALGARGSDPRGMDPRGPEARAGAGLCLMSTAFVSPYLFDYDLPVFCAGLTLALPALGRRLGPRRLGALLGCAALAASVGLVLTPLLAPLGGRLPSLGGPLLLACFVAAALALRSSPRLPSLPAPRLAPRPSPAEAGLTAAPPAAVAAP